MSALPTHLPTASLMVANMHCPSCVEAITELLANIPAVVNLSVSLLLNRVTFSVDTSISSSSSSNPSNYERIVDQVHQVLTTEGGFVVTDENAPVVATPEPVSPKAVSRPLAWLSRSNRRAVKENKVADERRRRHLEGCEACRLEAEAAEKGQGAPPTVPQAQPADQVLVTTLSIEGMTCASCTSSIKAGLKSHPAVLNADVALLSSSATVRHHASLAPAELVEMIDDTGFEAEVIESHPEAKAVAVADDEPALDGDALVRTTLSIEGMTCASCSSAIDRALRQLPEVTDTAIDVLGNKGIITHRASLSAAAIHEIIEDVGYDAAVVATVPVEPLKPTGPSKDGTRSVTVRVQGVFCNNCITQLNHHLATMPVKSFTPLSFHNPVTTVTYVPHHPLTIRDILSGLSNVAPEFDAAVARTQSLSERSQEIQRREVKLLAAHLAVAFIFAIPTFIIAIVSMVLLPMSSPFRQFWDKPVWGGANRGTVVLWALATVVQFGVGRLFYQRALNALWSHLRWLLPPFLRPASMRRSSAAASGRKFSWRSLFSFGSMDLLVSLSTTVSYFASIAMLALDVKAGPDVMTIGTYFDSGVFIIMFILLGRTLEAYAKSRTTDAVALLGTLRPPTAWLVEEGKEDSAVEELKHSLERHSTSSDETANGKGSMEKTRSSGSETPPDSSSSPLAREIPVDHVEYGDVLLVHPGALPPADGVIVSGHTTFDESSLTGESRPVSKSPGDDVFTGTTNQSAAVSVRVTSLAADTMLERIIRAVSDASGRKAPIERAAERLTGVFVPVVIYLSIIVLAVWLGVTFGGIIDPSHYHGSGGRAFFALEFAISVLVVACPCGIGLAVPCANAVGNGLAAAAGILASGGGEAFTAATKVTTIAFDKTGTLTVGRSVVTDEYFPSELPVDRSVIERATRDVEAQSTHPLAVGVVEHLKLKGTDARVSITESAEIAGRGLRATLSVVDADALELLVGNSALLAENGVHLSPAEQERVEQWTSDAKSVVLVAARVLAAAPSSSTAPSLLFSATAPFALAGMYALSDPPRETTAGVLATLRKQGYRLVMLSGDNAGTASAVARMVGIESEDVFAGVGPEGKADAIRTMQARTHAVKKRAWLPWSATVDRNDVVLFVGDGLNDAVALAAADASAAMGHGSQATLASADFVLLSSDLAALPVLLRLSKKVRTRQWLNLLWATLFNTVCMPIAAGVLFPAGLRLSPVWSAVLMALSSVSVVLSSLALRWGL
ncbi:uncharacterized protein EHS24_000811 [Apiotrichum porosum]|uniref:HMA domain-containing protein n=1 Tax=Apiotrichum porosum TaxID=105984 RepID=A0A427YBD3_9TREE|nr:uncharacterized protein EHS24_000811 [Apiotrichum porosum]RSH88277.1 hypothetical protein EHS24_000811 [Apiotrichum porosum]